MRKRTAPTGEEAAGEQDAILGPRVPRRPVTAAPAPFAVQQSSWTAHGRPWVAHEWLSEGEFPSGGTEYIASQLPAARLYNDYTWGGYIIYRERSLPVFIDGRSDFYRARILDDYITINHAADGWEDVVERYGIDTMLIPRGSRLASVLRRQGNWREVFTGDIESVFVKR